MGQDPQQGPRSQPAKVELGLCVPSSICRVGLVRLRELVLMRHVRRGLVSTMHVIVFHPLNKYLSTCYSRGCSRT